ncbi:beta strand repeat-containing protein [Luteimonas salinilitoris]|uniref:Beta strand repeat-containing protein n=1 Tax=Luteimonas salinilitoris TaxID=3237697 RepID=A0ABV4HS58_9GAMM
MSSLLPDWLKYNVSTGQVKVTVKSGSPGVTGTVSVAPDGTVSVTGGGATTSGFQAKASGDVQVSPDGTSFTANEVTLQVPGPGGTSVGIKMTPGGFVPHPTDPSAPPVPSAHIKATIGAKNFEFDVPLVDGLTMDDLFDRELDGWLSSGLLGDAYTKLRHRSRDLDRQLEEAEKGINNDNTYRIVRYDPLALDLNGDGLVGTRAESDWSGALFDHDGDGIRTATGWISSEDGLLVRDLDGNGRIDTGLELFGDETMLSDGSNATDGFQALASMDSNGDGVVDGNDDDFASIKVWRDSNGNGVTDDGELLSLQDLDIVRFQTSYSETPDVSVEGGNSVGIGVFTMRSADGSLSDGVMQDFNFDNDSLHSIYSERIPVPDSIKALANIQGLGMLRDLHEAATLSPMLEQSLRAFSGASSRDNQRAELDNLLIEWAKTSPYYTEGHIDLHVGGRVQDPNSTNIVRLRPNEVLTWPDPTRLDAQITHKVRTVEAILGYEPITDLWWGNDTVQQYVNVYDTFFEAAYASLSVQTRLQSYVDLIDVDWSATKGQLVFNFSELMGAFENKFSSDPLDAIIDLGELFKFRNELFSSSPWAAGESLLRSWLLDYESDPDLQAALSDVNLLLSNNDSGTLVANGSAQVDLIFGRDQVAGLGETLNGAQGDDVIFGGGGADKLNGADGDDTLLGGAGSDSLNGGQGDDIIFGDADNDSLVGSDGNDILNGGDGSDSLQGGNGDDRLEGGEGNDYLSGGEGNDVYAFGLGSGHDTINNYDSSSGNVDALDIGLGLDPSDLKVWRSGDDLSLQIRGTDDRIDVQYYFRQDGASVYSLDLIRFMDGTVWTVEMVKALVLNSEDNDDIYGYQTDDIITGNADNNWLVGRGGNDTLSGGAGSDSLSGDDGDDVLSGDDGNDSLSGGAGNDILNGGADNDRIEGGSGNDRIDGGSGNDDLIGGSGNDVYVFGNGSGQDYIRNYDSDVGRLDVLEFTSDVAPENIEAWRGNDDLFLRIQGTEDQVRIASYFSNDATGPHRLDEIRFSNGTVWDVNAVKAMVQIATDGDDVLQGFAGNDTISGGLGSDTLSGAAGDDVLDGGAGDDTLNGDAGNDTLTGGEGSDTLFGGDGNDELSGGVGIDALHGGFGDDVLDGGDDGDWLAGAQGSDIIRGGSGDDMILGGDGADHITGGLGDDQLEGNEGDDSYYFSRGDGKDTISDRDGHSTIYVSDLTTTEAYFRRDGANLVIRFASSPNDEIQLTGFFDPLTGLANSGLRIDPGNGLPWDITPVGLDAEVLKGTTADDVIYGNSLNNAIGGLTGNDTIHAEGGDDIVNGGQGIDRLYGGDGADQLLGGDGDDVLFGGTGNDVLTGEVGNDQLDGGAGQDQLAGGAGNDIYVVDDILDEVVELANEGADLIRSEVSYALPQHVETLELVGSANIDAAGNSDANELLGNGGNNRLEGLGGDDVLRGRAGNDTLLGGAGNDLLDGGSGVDHLSGGAGDDTYIVDSTQDVAVELAGEGSDIVQAHSNYTLSANIEKLVLVEGSGAYQGVGNAGANIIIGNTSNNRLDGAAGADTMTGGLGDDTYMVDNAGDAVVENAGEGSDTVESSIDYVLGATLENLTLLGTGNLQGTGNGQNNILIGNAGNNRLDGGAGGDRMHGGAGDDYFIVDSIDDWVYESSGEGVDTTERSFETNLVLSDNVENLIIAEGVTTGNGNGLDNVITGNSGSNTLGGWGGDDELHGLGGNDSLFGGVGTDRLFGGAGNDYLDGGEGVDHLEGGAGDDTYIVDASTDGVVETSGNGDDKVQTTASFTLTDNVETLFLMGSGAINGTGNGLDNYMAGNGAANIINGQGGSDTLVGGGGDDTLIGGTGDDKYVVNATSGSDVIDNTDGGFDGVFFTNGITRERLSFSRDGDDLLVSVDDNTVPAVRVLNHFLGGNAAIDYVQPDGGFYLTTAEINQIVAGGGTGGEYDQVIEGTASGEQLVGSSGKDLIKGLGGDDQLFGMAGNDTLQGGDGDDYLAGGNGSGSNSGADRLEGGAGNDTLAGEDGDDTLIGGIGNDSYVYGGGQDTIDNTGGGNDGVFFNGGIDVSRLGFSRDGDDLMITVDANSASTVRVTNHFLGGDSAIDYVQPDGGSMLDTAAINALVDDGPGGGDPGGGDDDDYSSVVEGTAAGEQLLGTNDRDLIRGLGGDDTIFGFQGDDKLEGGDGNDYLSGGNGSFSGSGNDILIGGAGADTLVGEDGDDRLFGGAGDDTYYYASGSGSDVIDNTGGGNDWIYLDGIARERLGFHRDGDDLIVRIDGDAGEQMRVLKHFQGGQHAIAFVQPGDGGYAIPASQFEDLLTPMSAVGMATTSGMRSSASGSELNYLYDAAFSAFSVFARGEQRKTAWDSEMRLDGRRLGRSMLADGRFGRLLDQRAGSELGGIKSKVEPSVVDQPDEPMSSEVQLRTAGLRLEAPSAGHSDQRAEIHREVGRLIGAMSNSPSGAATTGETETYPHDAFGYGLAWGMHRHGLGACGTERLPIREF